MRWIAFALFFSGCDATFQYTEVTDSAPEETTAPTCVTAGCPPLLQCDLETGLCERCTGSGDCPDDRPFCQVAIHQCVRCLEAVDCMSGEDCIDNHCVQTCVSELDFCKAPGTKCDPSRGLCLQCPSRPCMPPRGICATAYGRCEECLSDTDCPRPDHPHCQLSRHSCVECLHASDCPAARPVCTFDNHCVTT